MWNAIGVLTEDGQVFSFTSRNTESHLVFARNETEHVTQIAGAIYHFLVLTNTGRVFVWGLKKGNNFGTKLWFHKCKTM